jgi:hypothetical protein
MTSLTLQIAEHAASIAEEAHRVSAMNLALTREDLELAAAFIALSASTLSGLAKMLPEGVPARKTRVLVESGVEM